MGSSDIFELQEKAVTTLETACSYLKRQTVNGENTEALGWTQFLEEKQEFPGRHAGITGTTCGLVALIACGENPKSPLVRGAQGIVKSFQRCDGGWSTSPLQSRVSLTRPTCLSVSALTVAGEPAESPTLQKAVAWLVKARNSDGGWGNSAQDNMSDIISTALTIEALAKLKIQSPAIEEALADAAEWISNGFEKSDPEKKVRHGMRQNVVHTAHVVTALAAYGKSRAWLQEQVEWLTVRIKAILDGQLPAGDLQIHDDVSYSGPEGSWPQRVSWANLPMQRALLALFDSKVDLGRDGFLQDLVERIITDQKPEGFWQTDFHPGHVPVWLFTENCRVLRGFVDRVEEQREYLLLKMEFHRSTAEMNDRLSKLEEQRDYPTLNQTLTKFDSRLSILESRGIIKRTATGLHSVIKWIASLWYARKVRLGIYWFLFSILSVVITVALMGADANVVNAIAATSAVLALLFTIYQALK